MCALICFQVFNSKDLTEEMTKIQSVLSDDKNDWEHRVAAVRTFWTIVLVGLITSRCSGNEPALLQRPDSRERWKSSLLSWVL